jgi:hypothetical protein
MTASVKPSRSIGRAKFTVIEDPGPIDSHLRLVKLQPARGAPITYRRVDLQVTSP